MLVLKINEEREVFKKTKGIFRKTIIYEKPAEIKRYSIKVNEKPAIVLELPYNEIGNEEVLSLFKIYKGRVLVAEKHCNNDILKEYLFLPKEYYQRAILSSLKNQMTTVGREWKTLCIKTDSFSPFKELFQIVKICKAFTLVAPRGPLTDKFISECYYELGAIVGIKDACPLNTDVYLELDKIEESGKIMINVRGKEFILYPDAAYFADKEDYNKLLMFDIAQDKLQAAFSDK